MKTPFHRFQLSGFRVVLASAFVLVGASLSAANNLFVDSTGAGGAFRTVQAAINDAPAGTAGNRTIIFIKPGRYPEKIILPSGKPFLCLIGQTTDPKQVVLTFNLNATSPNSSGGNVGTSGSTSTFIGSTDFIAKNIMFENSSHDDIAQAVAIKTNADRAAFQNCCFWGFQDTLYVTGGRDYFKACTVTGDTDFIFGNATAVFDGCTINESGAFGFYTAANTKPTTAIGFVFLNCTLNGAPNTDIDPTDGTRYSTVGAVANNETYLGRPWQYATSKASVTLINTKMSPCVIAAGWSAWDSGNTNPGVTTRYAEFHSLNPSGALLDVSGRVSWSHQLSPDDAARYTLANIFGRASFWGPGFSDWGTFVSWDPVATLNSVPNQ